MKVSEMFPGEVLALGKSQASSEDYCTNVVRVDLTTGLLKKGPVCLIMQPQTFRLRADPKQSWIRPDKDKFMLAFCVHV